jgi:hypothetical protein
MCRDLKVIPDDFREVVGLRENVEAQLKKLPLSRRRAIWTGIDSIVRNSIFSAKSKLNPFVQITVDDCAYQFGAIHQGSCVTVVGIAERKLTIYSVIDKLRLLKRAGEPEYCYILDETVGKTASGRMRVVIAHYQFVLWAAFEGIKARSEPVVLDLLPEKITPFGQQERVLYTA